MTLKHKVEHISLTNVIGNQPPRHNCLKTDTPFHVLSSSRAPFTPSGGLLNWDLTSLKSVLSLSVKGFPFLTVLVLHGVQV